MGKIIFLDIDGVLNTKYWYSQMDRNTPKDQYGYMFDPISIGNLAKIVRETGADIVISSSWKSLGLSTLLDMWSDRNLPGRVIDITPNSVSDEILLHTNLDEFEMTHIRGCEIKEWLETKGREVTHYAIIDDMDNFLPEQQSHFVWIDPNVGITEGNTVQVKMILNHLEHSPKATTIHK